jgi:DNA-binding XRE family transcriptional regulator
MSVNGDIIRITYPLTENFIGGMNMYNNLQSEMIKANIKIAKLAIRIGVTEKTLRNKINGKTEFSWPEVLQIRNIVAPQLTLEVLFYKTNNTNECSI